MKKTVIITGASSGIGKAAAIYFAKHEYNLVICAKKNQAGLADTQRLAEEKGSRCISLLGDVSDYSFCKEIIRQAVSRFGGIDILINNAGIDYIGLFQDMEPSDWDHIIKVNLYSVFNMSHAVIPHMLKKHHGTIINVSSVWGNVGASCEAVYSASKGGINSFTRALAKELAPAGIRVNAISCGAIDTEMNAWMEKEEREALLEEIPMGRMGSPNEVAQLIYQMAEGPAYLTGQIVTLDGAWL